MRVSLLASLVAAALSAAAARAQTTAFVDVNLVTMEDERVLPRRTVVVRGGTIVAVLAAADSAAVPGDAVRVRIPGAYLMPGLADLHAHPVDPLLHPLYLSHGVTTVQYLNAFPEALGWSAEGAPGPRIAACGGPVVGVRTVDEARRVVAEQAAAGFDCIKISGDVEAGAFPALVAAARERGMRTVAHIPRNLGWADLLAAAPGAVAHAEEFLYSPIESEAAEDSIVAGMRARGISLVTTLTNYDLITRQKADVDALLLDGRLRYVPAVERRYWGAGRNRYLRNPGGVPGMRRLLRFQRTLVRRMADAGVPILLGTDAGNSFVLRGSSVHDELDQLVLAGLTPYQALRAATVAPAAFLGWADGGTIAMGKRADLLLVLGNPLEEVANARLIAGVMAGGRWLPADSLRALRAALAERLRPEAEMVEVLEARGLDAALAWLAEGGAALRPRALNELGYQLWKLDGRLADALRVFEANARLHPDWVPAAESLAEARAAASGAGLQRE